jgi:hypothetical protein
MTDFITLEYTIYPDIDLSIGGKNACQPPAYSLGFAGFAANVGREENRGVSCHTIPETIPTVIFNIKLYKHQLKLTI